MGVAAKEIGIRFLKCLIAEGLVFLIWKGIMNKSEGKTILGGQKKKGIVWMNGQKCYILSDKEGWVE